MCEETHDEALAAALDVLHDALPDAVRALVHLALHADDEGVQLRAIRLMLDVVGMLGPGRVASSPVVVMVPRHLAPFPIHVFSTATRRELEDVLELAS